MHGGGPRAAGRPPPGRPAKGPSPCRSRGRGARRAGADAPPAGCGAARAGAPPGSAPPRPLTGRTEAAPCTKSRMPRQGASAPRASRTARSSRLARTQRQRRTGASSRLASRKSRSAHASPPARTCPRAPPSSQAHSVRAPQRVSLSGFLSFVSFAGLHPHRVQGPGRRVVALAVPRVHSAVEERPGLPPLVFFFSFFDQCRSFPERSCRSIYPFRQA